MKPSLPLLALTLALTLAGVALRADTIGVKAVASAEANTNGDGPPAYPGYSGTQINTGLTTASAMQSLSASEGALSEAPGATSAGFASVSVSEGHIGMSFSASAEDIGTGEGSGSANWNDVVNVGGGLAAGTPVTLIATLGITAAFVGSGEGGASVSACFSYGDGAGTDWSLCTSGSRQNTFNEFDQYVEGTPTLPVVVHETILTSAGSQIAVAGEASGSADALCDLGACFPTSAIGPSNWQMLATDSAHFSIQSLTPGVILTTESGCSITSGYGCDPVPSATPEPPGLALMLGGLLVLAGLTWRRQRRVRA